MEDKNQFLRSLAGVAFFSGFSREDLALVGGQLVPRDVASGVTLFREGERGDALWVIETGRVRLVRQGPHGETIADLRGAGDTVGETAILAPSLRRNTAITDLPSRLWILLKTDFDKVLERRPTLAVPLFRRLSMRWTEHLPGPQGVSQPGRIVVLPACLPTTILNSLAATLGVALAEQTRRRVWLVDMREGEPPLEKTLGLVLRAQPPVKVEDVVEEGRWNKGAVFHPSGLAIRPVPLSLWAERLHPGWRAWINRFKNLEGTTLLVLPAEPTSLAHQAVLEADRVTVALREGEADPPWLAGQIDAVPSQRVLRLWLSPAGASANRDLRLPWPAELEEQLSRSGPSLLTHLSKATDKVIHRWARWLAGVRVGLALGSGAALGYGVIGLLKVLEREGLYPDVIAGTSMGALLGSFYAAGRSVEEIAEIARGITRARFYGLADVTFPWKGLVKGQRVHGFLKSVLGDVTFEELQLPFACAATDIETGDPVILREGPVVEAVRASVSLPFFMNPFYYQGRHLVDGGLIHPVPTSLLKELGADLYLSVNLTTRPSLKRFRHSRRYGKVRGPHILNILLKTIFTMQYEISRARAEFSHLILAPDLSRFVWSDFHRAEEIMQAGEAFAEEMLPRIKTFWPGASTSCPWTGSSTSIAGNSPG